MVTLGYPNGPQPGKRVLSHLGTIGSPWVYPAHPNELSWRPRDPGVEMRRRAFIAGLGGAAVARARQPNREARIGVLISFSESDPEGQAG